MTTLQKLFAAFIPVLAVACAAGPTTTDASGESGEAISGSACVNVKTLSCKADEEVSMAGCIQSRVYGAAAFGKCAKSEDAGADASTEDASADGGVEEDASADGGVEEDASADGGTDEDADVDAGADETCVDETTLDCIDGTISEQGCLQSNVVGAHRYGFCVSQ